MSKISPLLVTGLVAVAFSAIASAIGWIDPVVGTMIATGGLGITFDQMPSQILVPWVGVEFDASRAEQGPGQLSYRVLLIGQKTDDGTAAGDSVVRVRSLAEVITLAGRGSMLARMAQRWFEANRSTEVWIGVLEDPSASGSYAYSLVKVVGAATESGTIHLYLGGDHLPGRHIRVGVVEGDDGPTIAQAIVDAVNAELDLTVTASVTNDEVLLESRHKGEVGNDLDIRLNYRDGETTPAGVVLEWLDPETNAFAYGAVNPELAGLIANMGDNWFNLIVSPYTDDASVDALKAEMDSRNGPMRSIDGLVISGVSGSMGAVSAIADAIDSRYFVLVPSGYSPTPPHEIATQVAAVLAYHAAEDPARPHNTLALPSVLPPWDADVWTLLERNSLLGDGVSSLKPGPGGTMQIERLVTTYLRNASGADDTAYRDVTTMLTLMFLRYDWRRRVLNKYPRHKLANDGTPIGAGQAVVTPSTMKAELIGWFIDMQALGLVEGLAQFKRDAVVERNQTDPNRLDVLMPPDLINQLIAVAVKNQFRL